MYTVWHVDKYRVSHSLPNRAFL